MKNRWVEAPASPVEQLVYQSRLVSEEEPLALWGGGNNSVKTTAIDLPGSRIDVMLIKSSGSDMKSIAPKQFPGVRLEHIGRGARLARPAGEDARCYTRFSRRVVPRSQSHSGVR